MSLALVSGTGHPCGTALRRPRRANTALTYYYAEVDWQNRLHLRRTGRRGVPFHDSPLEGRFAMSRLHIS
jgi:hypothetical protein